MTYRKLFLRLFTGSTVLLLVLWGVSLFYSATARRTPFRFTIIHGTLESGFTRTAPMSANNDIVFIETFNGGFQALPDRGMAHPLGRWKAAREGEHVLPKPSPTDPPDLVIDTLHVPLWVPWLLIVSCAFFFCRLMEKRSASGREKRLAEGGMVGRMSGPPH